MQGATIWGGALTSAGTEAVEGLVAAPRKVERITISYAQASKQVGMEHLTPQLCQWAVACGMLMRNTVPTT